MIFLRYYILTNRSGMCNCTPTALFVMLKLEKTLDTNPLISTNEIETKKG